MSKMFRLIEEPEKGWETLKIEQERRLDAPNQWSVTLLRSSDGMRVTHTHEDLYVAWARAAAKAGMENMEAADEPPVVIKAQGETYNGRDADYGFKA